MSEYIDIDTRAIQLSKSRPIDPDAMLFLRDSMAVVGLINAVVVRGPEMIYDGQIMCEGYKVIAGDHRVLAARHLEWKKIRARVIKDVSELQQRLITLDENLARTDFSIAARGAAMASHREAREALGAPNNGRLSPTIGQRSRGRDRVQENAGRPKEFATVAAAATGLSKRTINDDLKRADALGVETMQKLAGTSLDSGPELDALTTLSPKDRSDLIRKATAGKQVSAAKLAERARQVSAEQPEQKPTKPTKPKPAPLMAADTRPEPSLSATLAEITRLFTVLHENHPPERVAQAMADRAINPDLLVTVDAYALPYRRRGLHVVNK